MKKSSVLKFSILSIVCLAIVIACSVSLDPAINAKPNETKTETTLTLAFPSLPSAESQPRAAIQGGGYLYIQTGSDSSAKLYGPYQVDGTNTVALTDIPAGVYPFFAVLYVSEPLPALAPVTAMPLTDSLYRAEVMSLVPLDAGASCKLLSDVSILSNRRNQLSCTLLPFAIGGFNCGYAAAGATFDFTGDGHRFVNLSYMDSVPAGTRLVSTKINLKNTSASVLTVLNAAIYNADGTLAAAAPAGSLGAIAAGATATCLDFPNHGASEFILYVRYAGSGLQLSTPQTRTTSFMYATSDGTAVRTIDGTSWGSTPTGLASCSDLSYGANGFVACGKDSSGYVAVATSRDGYDWTVKVVDNIHASLLAGYLGVRPSDGAMVMTYLSGATGYASTSLDGWTTTNGTGISGTDSGNAYMSDGWYASSSNGSGWRKTTDGVNWITATIGSCSMYQISLRAYVGGVFFVGGAYNGSGAYRSVYRSVDYGATFSGPITLPCSTMSYPNEIMKINTGRLVEFGDGVDADRVCYSDNLGVTWTSVATPAAAVAFNCASATPWGIYAGTSSGLVYVSSDNAVTFAAITVPTSTAIAAMSAASF